jgi:hypothetical protein
MTLVPTPRPIPEPSSPLPVEAPRPSVSVERSLAPQAPYVAAATQVIGARVVRERAQ